jgi:transcriptional regulator with XRE-family HTH domain
VTAPLISGAEIKALREERGWSQSELADILNAALGTKFRRGAVGSWENERPGKNAKLTPGASVFLQELASGEIPAREDESELPPPVLGPAAEDLPPRWDERAPQPALVSGGGAYAKACEELWEIIASGVGMVGAATGSDALVEDGRIINRDKAELGKAWGKLAETNDTFRKMLMSMTEGGAWMQVALVTGTTASRCYQSHNEIARRQRSFAMPPAQEAEVPDAAPGLHAIS